MKLLHFHYHQTHNALAPSHLGQNQTHSWPLYKINTLAKKATRAQVATVVPLLLGQRLMEENTANVLSLIRHMGQFPAAGCRLPGGGGDDAAATRQMYPPSKQNAYVNYTGQQNNEWGFNFKSKLCSAPVRVNWK